MNGLPPETQMHTNSVQPSFTLREKLKFLTIRDAEGSNIYIHIKVNHVVFGIKFSQTFLVRFLGRF